MRIVRTAVASVLLPMALAIGCSRPGSEFVGKWVNTGNSMDTLEITRGNNDQYQIVGPQDQPIQATYSDGALHVPMAVGTLDLKYDSDTKTIQTPAFSGMTEYKRAK
jgi:hypothetical protein